MRPGIHRNLIHLVEICHSAAEDRPFARWPYLNRIIRVIQKKNFIAQLTLATILPLTKPIGTGPYTLESLDAVKLSPETHTCPFGMRKCSLASAY